VSERAKVLIQLAIALALTVLVTWLAGMWPFGAMPGLHGDTFLILLIAYLVVDGAWRFVAKRRGNGKGR